MGFVKNKLPLIKRISKNLVLGVRLVGMGIPIGSSVGEKTAELILGKAGITVNKNMIPFDSKSPFVTSGIRLGTPALTTRGMSKVEMKQIVSWIDQAIKHYDNEYVLLNIKQKVKDLCSNFPIYEH